VPATSAGTRAFLATSPKVLPALLTPSRAAFVALATAPWLDLARELERRPPLLGWLAVRLVVRLLAVAVARLLAVRELVPARDLPFGERLALEVDRDLPLVDEFLVCLVLACWAM
jgi:hypothetical protein